MSVPAPPEALVLTSGAHASCASHAFADGLAAILALLSGGSRGAGLAPLVQHVQQLLSDGDVHIELDASGLTINGETSPRNEVAALRDAMQSNQVRSLHLRAATSARDLVHLAALLAGPTAANGVGFGRLWTLHGSWHIVVEAVENHVEPLESLNAPGTEDVIERIARLIGEGASATPSSASYERLVDAGERATDVLFTFLVRAPTGAERRRYFDAIVSLPAGSARLIAALSHPTWFVVRNAVALLSAKQVQGVADALTRTLGNPDRRVRLAVTEALVRMPDECATDGLQAAATDRCAKVRHAAWSAFSAADRVPKPSQLNDALQHEPDLGVLGAVISAARTHIEQPSPGALVRCIAHLLSRGDQMAMACDALEVLAVRQPRSAIPLLRRICDHGESETRMRARVILQTAQDSPVDASAA